jgi:hypothetical protein
MTDHKDHGSSVLKTIFNSHTLIHGVLMLGMVLTPVAALAASAGTTATFGDLALGMWDMGKSMVLGLGDSGVLVDAFSNAVDGNFLPSVPASVAENAAPILHRH